MSAHTAAPHPFRRPHGGESNSHAHVPAWAVLAVACVAQFMVVLDISIVNVALPSIAKPVSQHGLGLDRAQLQWIVNAYALAFAGFLLFGGRAGDLFGRKKIFLVGLGIFTLASLVGGFSQNAAMIEISRAVQGLGGGILAPSTLSLLTTTYTDHRARARALGVWSATAGSGGAFGALAGGVLTDLVSWRWVLFVNVPIGVVLFVGAVIALRESRGQVRNIWGLDIPGTVTVTSGLAVLVYAIVSTNTHPWGSTRTLATLGVAAALLIAFVVIEKFTSQPMVPLRIFKMRALSSANGIAVAVGAAMFSMFFFLSLYMQDVLNYSPLAAGLAFLPGALLIIAGATISSRLVSHVGPRRLLVIGGLLSAIALWWLSRLPSSGSYAVHVLPPLMLVCFGMGMSMVPMTVAATSGVDRSEAGLASGLLNTTRQVGGALGLAVLGTIATDHSNALLGKHLAPAVAATSGFDRAFVVASFVALAGALLALTLPSRSSHVAAVEQSARDHAQPRDHAQAPERSSPAPSGTAEQQQAEPAIFE
jgi:EmrB/QacA subfamily drug resistance transporter